MRVQSDEELCTYPHQLYSNSHLITTEMPETHITLITKLDKWGIMREEVDARSQSKLLLSLYGETYTVTIVKITVLVI